MSNRTDEAREAELDRLIEKRHDERAKSEGERAVEEVWQVTARIHAERERQEARCAWCEYHRHMQSLHERLAAEHEERALKLLEDDDQEGERR